MTPVGKEQRFTAEYPCPICGGFESLQRGQQERCFGYLSSTSRTAYCTREQYAGRLTYDSAKSAFPHRLSGTCACGKSHAVQIEATYPYCDKDGRLLFQVVRLRPKTFRQRRPNGDDGWIWNLSGVPRVLYRLDQIQGQTSVSIVEGEKDADRLWDLDIPATCNPMGAGNWLDNYASQLTAAGIQRVNVFRDNDVPGRRHAVAVEGSCLRAGLRVHAVHLPDAAKDVSEWLDAGHTVEELQVVMQAAIEAEVATLAETARDSVADSEAEVICLADVRPEKVQWVWPGRIAAGKLGLLIGDPGEGKSYVLADTAARISRGDLWPNGSRAPQGSVLFLSAEDGLADTMRPRLDVLGADVTRIHVLRGMRDHNDPNRIFSLETDLPALENQARRLQPVLIVIDPLSAYLGDRDSYKDAEMRRLLTPLVMFAEKHCVAVMGVMHLTKASDRRAIHRMIGSVAFSAISRLVSAVGHDPNDESRRIVASVKSNISKGAPALAFRLVDPPSGEQPMLVWEREPVEGFTADRLLGAATDPEEREEQKDAGTLLMQLLTSGPMKARDVFNAAKDNGISDRTLRRAKKRLHIVSTHSGAPGKPGPWWWSLPDSPIGVGNSHLSAANASLTATYEEMAVSIQPSVKKDEEPRSFAEVAKSHATAVSGNATPGSDRVVEIL